MKINESNDICDILFVQTSDSYTGSSKVLSDIIRTYYSDKIVYVLSSYKTKGFISELSNVKFIGTTLLKPFGRKIPYFSVVFRRIEAFFKVLWYGRYFSTIYLNTIQPDYAAIAGKIIGKPITYHIHEKYQKKSIGIRIQEFVFKHTYAKRIYVSNYLQSQYPNPLNCPSEIKYNFLNSDFLSKVKMRPICERKLMNILMISSLSVLKGVVLYKKIAESLPTFTFELVVSANTQQIKDFFGSDTPKNLRIYPTQSDIHPFLERADLLMNLSNPFLCIETFGMTILEAMPYAIPAIVPNVGGPIELVNHGKNGYCVDTSNKDEVIMYILKALTNGIYETLANNTFKIFNKKFNRQ